jgi:hypothetical protein
MVFDIVLIMDYGQVFIILTKPYGFYDLNIYLIVYILNYDLMVFWGGEEHVL